MYVCACAHVCFLLVITVQLSLEFPVVFSCRVLVFPPLLEATRSGDFLFVYIHLGIEQILQKNESLVVFSTVWTQLVSYNGYFLFCFVF